MKSYSSRKVIKILRKNRWYEVGCVGDHHHFKHPTIKGKTTIPHSKSTIPKRTLNSISEFMGIQFP